MAEGRRNALFPHSFLPCLPQRRAQVVFIPDCPQLQENPPEASCMVSQGLGVIWLCLCSTSIIPPSASLFMSFAGSACPAC